jgi:FkbM family methyltransferase
MTTWQRWIVRPYLRRELPRWERLYQHMVGNHHEDVLWAGEPRRWGRGKLHGYDMDLDLARASERFSYFTGRFYELGMQLLLMDLVRAGDRVVDIGANVGEISLLCSRLVGPTGVVDAFEPNPRCADRLASAIARNRIGNIRLHRKGLASAPAELCLAVPRSNSGEGSFAHAGVAANGAGDRVETFRVPVGVGDEELAADPSPVALIKIDVEGFEIEVLGGLTRTLVEQKPLVTTEVVAEHLARAGRTPADLYAQMGELGYEAYGFDGWRKRRRFGLSQSPRRWRRRFELSVDPANVDDPPHDVLWIPRGRPQSGRLADAACCMHAIDARIV